MMNIKKFEKVARILSLLLLVISFISLVSLIFLVFFNNETLTVTPPSFSFSMSKVVNQATPNAANRLAATITAFTVLLLYAYLFYRGSQLFKGLSKGQTPFSIKNYKLLREIGLIIIAVNLLAPLLYSLITTLNMSGGYYFVFGVDTEIIVGLVIYCIAEIIRYGVTLQNLSDETV